MSTYDDIRAAIDAAESAGLPVPRVDLNWHRASEELAADVVRAFPDRDWQSAASGASEWVKTDGDVDLSVFLAQRGPEKSSTARADAILAEASA